MWSELWYGTTTHGKDASDGLAESFDEIVIVAAAAFLARN
jgi:hypothetical protein